MAEIQQQPVCPRNTDLAWSLVQAIKSQCSSETVPSVPSGRPKFDYKMPIEGTVKVACPDGEVLVTAYHIPGEDVLYSVTLSGSPNLKRVDTQKIIDETEGAVIVYPIGDKVSFNLNAVMWGKDNVTQKTIKECELILISALAGALIFLQAFQIIC